MAHLIVSFFVGAVVGAVATMLYLGYRFLMMFRR